MLRRYFSNKLGDPQKKKVFAETQRLFLAEIENLSGFSDRKQQLFPPINQRSDLDVGTPKSRWGDAFPPVPPTIEVLPIGRKVSSITYARPTLCVISRVYERILIILEEIKIHPADCLHQGTRCQLVKIH